MIQLSKEQFLEILTILDKYFADSEIWFFGSRITGEAKKYSDLDILIKSKEQISDSTMFYARSEFAESNLPFTIDLVDWNNTTENFRELIFKNAVSKNELQKKYE